MKVVKTMDLLLTADNQSAALLNDQGTIGLFLFSLLLVSALSLVMVLAYASSKTFVNIELDKLEESVNKFDKFIILSSGVASFINIYSISE